MRVCVSIHVGRFHHEHTLSMNLPAESLDTGSVEKPGAYSRCEGGLVLGSHGRKSCKSFRNGLDITLLAAGLSPGHLRQQEVMNDHTSSVKP